MTDFKTITRNMRDEISNNVKGETKLVLFNLMNQIEKCFVDAGENETLISHISTIKHDAVNHPKHYTSHPSGVECIDIARHMGFNLGNALKYLWRCDLKHDSPVEDLEKAIFYINDEIELRKKRNDRSKNSE